MDKEKIIVIAGPTASGKTAAAVELCKLIGGEVVSADSMQIYRGMDVLSAKPTVEEMDGVPHHMLGIADPKEKFSAAKYRDMAKEVISGIVARGNMPVICGGTGLYINAMTRPMDFSEKCDEALRKELLAMADMPGGREKLHAMLKEIDPETAQKLHYNDVRRVTRAIEVFKLTGITQTEQAKLDAQREGDYDETFFALSWPRDILYDRINRRVDIMLKNGLIDEVRELRKDEENHPTSLQAIGYKEIAAALEGRMSMEDAVILVKQLSRNYAKKQMTWFQRDSRCIWLEAQEKTAKQIAVEMIRYLEEHK